MNGDDRWRKMMLKRVVVLFKKKKLGVEITKEGNL